MNTTNPKISSSTSVHNLLLNMPRKNPSENTVVGTIEVPNWRGVNNHFQGIAPLNGVAAITGQISASADTWWCASFQSGNPSTVTAVFGTTYYDHAGGIQRLGDLLPVPLENDNGEATVAFYDVSGSPRLLYEIGVTTGKASAVGITNYRDSEGTEQAMLLVYRYDPKSFYVYRARVDQLSLGQNAWEYVTETRSIETKDDDQYQCFSLVTESRSAGADVVVLLGFREDEEVVRYTVGTGPGDYGSISEVQWTYVDWDGSQWRYGVGLQISSPTQIRIFGCSEDPDGDRDDYDFPIYVWQ